MSAAWPSAAELRPGIETVEIEWKQPAIPLPPNLGVGVIVVGFDAIDVYVYECVTDTDVCKNQTRSKTNRVSVSCHAQESGLSPRRDEMFIDNGPNIAPASSVGAKYYCVSQFRSSGAKVVGSAVAINIRLLRS